MCAQHVLPLDPGVQLGLGGAPDPPVELVPTTLPDDRSAEADDRTCDLAELHPDGGPRQGALVPVGGFASTPEIVGKKERARRRRRRLLEVARGLLPKGHGTRRCHHAIPGRDVVMGRRGEDGPASARDIQQCGNAWTCAPCAFRRAVEDARDMERAVAAWTAGRPDRAVAMLTLTVRHHAGQAWGDVVGPLLAARRRLWSGRRGQRLRTWVRHHVTALECTHGEHGPHPHLHVLLWLEAPDYLDLVVGTEARGEVVGTEVPGEVLTEGQWRVLDEDWLRGQWVRVAALEGLDADRDHGLDIRLGSADVGRYIAKWGLGAEVAFASAKAGRTGASRTPWDVLADWDEHRRPEDARLWRDYVGAMRGRHRLNWSKGARAALLGAEEAVAEDDELVVGDVDAEPEAEWAPVAVVPAAAWAVLLALGAADRLLVAVGRVEPGYEQAVVDHVLARLDQVPRTRSRGPPCRAGPPAFPA